MVAKLKLPGSYHDFCLGISVLGWIPAVVTPPVIHGGNVATELLSWGGVVLGAYFSLELVRSGKHPWYKSPAMVGVSVYSFLTAVGLYYALHHLR